jgi:N-acetylneuraminic acid mutarotase
MPYQRCLAKLTTRLMTKYFLLLIAFGILACADDDEEDPRLGTWKELNNLPFEGRVYGVSFSLLGKGYLVSGRNIEHRHLQDVWNYDPAKDLWTEKNKYPFYFQVEYAVTTNDKAYIIDYTGRLYEYDPVPDSWKYLSMFPTKNRPHLTGFGLGGNIYFGTGNGVTEQKYYKDFWKYDVSKNEWIQINDFPGVERSTAISFVIGDHAYAGLGSSAGAPPIHQDVYSYDANTGQWKQIADLPDKNFLVGLSFSSDSKGYIGLSERNHAEMYEYDPATNSWRVVAKFPSEFSILTNSFTINNRMFVFGGKSGDYGQQLWEFVP